MLSKRGIASIFQNQTLIINHRLPKVPNVEIGARATKKKYQKMPHSVLKEHTTDAMHLCAGKKVAKAIVIVITLPNAQLY